MIQLSSAGKRFGPKLLFQDLDWMITTQERAGLVGANGTGKSTIMKVLAGMDTLDYGERNATKGMSAGYLPQDGLALSGRTAFQECMSVFADLKAIEKEIETLQHGLPELDPESEEYRISADRLHRLESEFITRDGYALEAQVGTVLDGLGFRKEEWTKRTEEFSGGWQMRIALAKLLLEKPNLLLLDEPTNHLDLEARNWLEGYLNSYPNAFVLISHDRYFLDVTVKRIVELWNKKAHFYSGNYSKFLKEKDERRAQLFAAHRNQQERIQQLEAFINRFRYQATKAKQVQSRIKELEKIDRIEIPNEEKTIHFTFPQPKASGRIVAELKGVSKAYGEKLVLSDVNCLIERGDRVALVGINGAGKSTLIKLLAGTEPLTTGEYTLGHNVEMDYFAQDQYKELDGTSRILDDLREAAPRSTETELRSLLGCFLFSEDDVFKQIGVLSGGERNRYALARMLLRPSNFLLLDEPTNHLDLRAKDVLLESLSEFTGTVVFVSHDRYFIDKLATKVFEIADGQLNVFSGNYEDYLFRKTGQYGGPGGSVAEAIGAGDLAVPVNGTHDAGAKPDHAKGKRLNPIKMKQLQQRCSTLEADIARLEREIADLEQRLSNFVSVEETQRLAADLDARRAELERKMGEWESATEELSASS